LLASTTLAHFAPLGWVPTRLNLIANPGFRAMAGSRLGVMSVALRDSQRPLDFRYAPLATRMRGGAICREGPLADIGRRAS
jgi:hypothetical protein